MIADMGGELERHLGKGLRAQPARDRKLDRLKIEEDVRKHPLLNLGADRGGVAVRFA